MRKLRIIMAINHRPRWTVRGSCCVDFEFLRPRPVPGTPAKPIPRRRALKWYVAGHRKYLIRPQKSKQERVLLLKDVTRVTRCLRLLKKLAGCRYGVDAQRYFLHRKVADNGNLKGRDR